MFSEDMDFLNPRNFKGFGLNSKILAGPKRAPIIGKRIRGHPLFHRSQQMAQRLANQQRLLSLITFLKIRPPLLFVYRYNQRSYVKFIQ